LTTMNITTTTIYSFSWKIRVNECIIYI